LTAARARAIALPAAVILLVALALAVAAARSCLFAARARDITAVVFTGPTIIVDSPSSDSGGGGGGPDTGARVTVEVAVTAEERRRGLAGRPGLEPSTGMLFVYRNERSRRFTMEGMLFALDVIAISGEGVVTGVTTRRPGAPVFETAPACYVLEVVAGWAAAHGVTVGTRVELVGGG